MTMATQSSASVYRYKPLREERKEIRLLQVSISEKTPRHSFTCKLKHVSLEDDPQYVALSYVWEDASSRKAISVDGDTMHITTNLSNALQSLVDERSDFVIWVDGICINQADDEEKSLQVARMQNIYYQATEVIAWLGSADGNSGRAMNFWGKLGESMLQLLGLSNSTHRLSIKELETFAREKENEGRSLEDVLFGLALNVTGDRRLHQFFDPLKELIESDLEGFGALFDIFTRPWWGRIWILQESTLAKQLTYACGPARVGGILGDAGLFALWTGLKYHFIPNSPAIKGQMASAVILKIFFLKDVRFSLRQKDDRPTLIELLSIISLEHNQFVSRSMLATDPRDQIFALLGLASDSDAIGIDVTYSRPCAEVYTQATRRFIQQAGDLAVLSMVQWPKVQPGLPSWVPDLSCRLHESIDRTEKSSVDLFKTRNFSASGSFGPRYGPGEDRSTGRDRQLALQGVRLDRVLAVVARQPGRCPVAGSYNPAQREAAEVELMEFLANMAAWMKEAESLNTGHLYPENHNPLWRTVTGDHVQMNLMNKTLAAWIRTAEYDDRILDQWYRVFRDELYPQHCLAERQEGPLQPDVLTSYMLSVVSQNANRRLFATQEGLIGLGPEDIRPGDVLVILFGGTLPFILREATDRNTQVHDDTLPPISLAQSEHHLGESNEQLHHDRETPRYHLIGEAYVDGIMDGELMEEDPTDDTEVFIME